MSLSGWERAERSDPYYKACMAGSAVLGTAVGAVGSAGNPLGAAGGFVAGLVVGYMACPYVAPALRYKIEQSLPMSQAEVRSAADAMGRYVGVSNAHQALRLLAIVRTNPKAVKGARCTVNPEFAALQLLS